MGRRPPAQSRGAPPLLDRRDGESRRQADVGWGLGEFPVRTRPPWGTGHTDQAITFADLSTSISSCE